jgi:glycosyltransferase involved in cell wall biosynthesis
MREIFIFSPLPPQENGVAAHGYIIRKYFPDYKKIYVIDGRQHEYVKEDDYSVITITEFTEKHKDTKSAKLFQFANNRYMVYFYKIFMEIGGIAEIHEEINYYYQSFLPGKYRSDDDFTLRIANRATAVIVHSYFLYFKIKREYPNIDIVQLFTPKIILVGENQERLCAFRNVYKIADDAFVISACGFADRRKKVNEVLRSFARIREDNLVFIAAGRGSRKLLGHWSRKNIHNKIIIEEYLSEEDFAALLQLSDLVVNLRDPWFGENSGIVATAMSIGKCVLVSDVGSFAELPDDVVLKIDNNSNDFIGQIKNTLLKCIRDKSIPKSIGQNAGNFMQLLAGDECLTKQYNAIVEKSLNITKRILIIATFNPFNASGMSTLLLAQCDMLKLKGCKVDFIFYALDYWDSYSEFEMRKYFDRVTIVRPETFSPEICEDGISLKTVDEWCPAEFLEAVASECSHFYYEAAIAHHIWTSLTLIAIKTNTKKFLLMHDNFANRTELFKKQGLDPRSAWFSVSEAEQNKGMQRADVVFAVQNTEAEYFRSQIDDVPVVTIGILFKFDPLPSRGRVKRIGYIASNNPNNKYNLLRMLSVWQENKFLSSHCEFVVCGKITECLSVSHSSIINLGVTKDVKDFYKQIDIAVNPDTTGTGIKIKSIEAISYGKALVCTKIASIGLDSTCKYHNAKNIEEIFAFIADIVNSNDLCKDLENISRETFHTYIKKYDYSNLFCNE